MTRLRILLNDSAACNKFSTLDLSILSGTGVERIDIKGPALTQSIAAGIRVIKRSGDTISIDVDSMVHEITGHDKNPRGAFIQKAISIPGLEPGDCLDIFSLMKRSISNICPETYNITASTIYPVLSHTGEILIEKNLSASYRTLNGMPEPTDSITKKKSHILRYSLPTQPAIEEPFNLPYRQLPILQLNIFDPELGPVLGYAQKKGVHPNPTNEETLDLYVGEIDALCYNAKEETKQILRTLKGDPIKEAKNKLKNKEWTEEQAADFLYNTAALAYNLNELQFSSSQFMATFGQMLTQCGIDFRYAFITTETGPRWEDMFAVENYRTIIKLYLSGKTYAIGYAPTAPGELTSIYRKSTGQIETFPAKLATHREKLRRNFSIPDTSITESKMVNHIAATLYGNAIHIKRNSEYHGDMKISAIPLVDPNQYKDTLLCHLKTYIESINYAKPDKQRPKEENKLFVSMRRSEDAAMFHRSTELPEQIQFDIKSYGFTAENPEFAFTSEYILHDMAKTPEDTTIIDIGRLCGIPFDVTAYPTDRKTEFSIFPKVYEDILIVKSTDDHVFAVEEISNLNISVRNEIGKFTSTANLTEDGLEVKRYIVFNENVMTPPGKWSQLLDIYKACETWQSKTIRIVPKKIMMYM